MVGITLEIGEQPHTRAEEPHPERLADPELGGTDGRAMFAGLLAALV